MARMNSWTARQAAMQKLGKKATAIGAERKAAPEKKPAPVLLSKNIILALRTQRASASALMRRHKDFSRPAHFDTRLAEQQEKIVVEIDAALRTGKLNEISINALQKQFDALPEKKSKAERLRLLKTLPNSPAFQLAYQTWRAGKKRSNSIEDFIASIDADYWKATNALKGLQEILMGPRDYDKRPRPNETRLNARGNHTRQE